MSFVKGPVPTRIKLIQGAGAMAFGVKDSGFSFFLLIFYNQVLGMDAGEVGAALGLALIADALVDPLLGYLSDRTYTRWGRRLPWLYAAPIPLAFLWVMLWSPPGGEAPSFMGLLGICIGVRLMLSACEVPSVALLPEITADYDERTTLFRYRYMMGWLGGLLMMILAYFVFMVGPRGILSPQGYTGWGIVGACVMVVSVIGSAAGLHKTVAHLPPVKPPPFSWRAAFADIREAFSERAFVIFACGALAAYVSQGLTFSITQYVNTYVWRFDATAFRVYPAALAVSVFIMFLVVSPLHRRFGKPRTAAFAALLAFTIAYAPYVFYLLGLWPQTGTLTSTATYYAFVAIGNTCGIVTMISASSMVAEIVEAFQERTGRRAEGSFYSGNWLVQKCATGMGIFISGQIISLAALPANAQPGEVGEEVLTTMILLYGAVSLVLAVATAWFLYRFPISRADHEARVAALDKAARGDIDATMTPP
ncbi:MFS transporter [Qipengyuania sp.]|uniref:MFS transporter n=1 Tax=Qipengyuania sp. TaxID=2004515 RepID=UPI0035C83FF5